MKWRCEDCFGRPVFCSQCLRSTHHLHPFHHVSRWDGECFTRSTLEKAGVTLNLGHAGMLCPKYRVHLPSNIPSRTQPQVSADSPSSSRDAPDTLHEPHTAPASQIAIPPFDHVREAEVADDLHADDLRADDLRADRFIDSQPAADATTRSPSSTLEEINGQFYHDLYEWRLARSPPPSKPDLDIELDPLDPIDQQIQSDPFFVGESEDEDGWRSAETGGIPLKNRSLKRADDKYNCPILTVIDITGIHQI